MQARILVDIFRMYEINLSGIVISDTGFTSSLISLNVNTFYMKELTEEQKKEALILNGTNEKNNDEIKALLINNGFKRLFYSNNWNETNDKLRRIYLEYYLQEKKIENLEKEIRFQDKECNIDFKIAKMTADESYMSMLVGEWHDIIASSIFNDYSIMTEGAYELEENVTLQPDDIVFDLGANIGMFSCVAAAKGCNVYAFEPTKDVIKKLEYNSRLNKRIQICEYAVGDEDAMIKFYESSDTGMNSIIKRGKELIETIVEGITLDTFVEKYHIERVDFIKADIEGAERNMLRGAQKVLQRFAPKLALCTYHLSDDPEVMEQLILQANPNYKIEHKWKKIYAYVPQN